MATAGHYKELTDGWKITRRAEGIIGTRVFHDADTEAEDSLPDVGDLFDTEDETLTNLKAFEIEETLYGGHPSKHLYTINYTTNPGATESSNTDESGTEPDYLPVSGSLSGEAISVDGTRSDSSWVWDDDVDVSVNQHFSKKIISGNFRITRRVSVLALATWCQYNNKINSADMKIAGSIFGTELVLYNGVEYEEYRNNLGLRRWKATFNFSVKLLPHTSDIYYGWNYIYDDATNKFRKPLNVEEESEDYLYQTADLNKLLAVEVSD